MYGCFVLVYYSPFLKHPETTLKEFVPLCDIYTLKVKGFPPTQTWTCLRSQIRFVFSSIWLFFLASNSKQQQQQLLYMGLFKMGGPPISWNFLIRAGQSTDFTVSGLEFGLYIYNYVQILQIYLNYITPLCWNTPLVPLNMFICERKTVALDTLTSLSSWIKWKLHINLGQCRPKRRVLVRGIHLGLVCCGWFIFLVKL